MYEAWIEYIDSNNQNKSKFVDTIIDIEDLINKIFLDEYIREYIYMPEAIIVIRKDGQILNRFIIKEQNKKILLVSIEKVREMLGL